MPSYWTCRKCGARNVRTASRRCGGCGENTKRARRTPEHRRQFKAAPQMVWDAINVSIHGLSGNVCAICSRPPSPNRKLDRDHDHQTGRARGLLCVSCNKNKVGRLTLEDARAVVAYLERVEAFYANVDRTRP